MLKVSRMKSAMLSLAMACSAVNLVQAADAPKLKLEKGDHVAIIGNTLPDRMQHDAYFETLMYARYPKEGIVVRDLAAAGDEVVMRSRSDNFGTPDEWLTRTKADVILAFFGFNESFKGKEGLEQFKADLDKYLKATLAKNYNGKSAPRIVLFSPIANEKTQDPNFPDPAVNNANLQMYAAAMAEVAKANNVQFVDLFEPSQKLYAEAAAKKQSLTINGIHLSEAGDKLLAPIMFQAAFEETAPAGDFEKLRMAIIEKNWQWHCRYRTMDGYNVYGGRSQLAYENGKGGPKISNFKVMQEEMSQRDVITANRDKVVFAAAQGQELKPEDNDLPPVDDVKTNHPGSNPDGSWQFLSGDAAIAKMKMPAGCKVTLYADETQFPELVNPVQMAWDTKGRLWISAWHNYPERTPTSTVGDSLLIFEDTKGTGKADKCTHFLDDLNCPTGFQFHKDGVLVMQAPDLWFAKDTNGDGKADSKVRILMGMDSADSHHTTNAMSHEPGGAVYLSDGVFHRTQVETAAGPVRNNDAATYRFEPNTGRFDVHTAYGYANPHGKVFTYWGDDLLTDATGNNTYFGPAISGHIDFPQKHPGIKEFWSRPSRPCPGTGLLQSKAFPEEFQNNFLNCNVISFQGIYRVKMSDDGSGLKGETLEPLVSSEDPNFRPTGVSVGPDGAVYFMDWSNSIIGHMQHHLRDPNRDHIHGRIYRMTFDGMATVKPAKIDGQPVAALLDLLKAPENQTRELAKVELDKHPTTEVMPALTTWIAGLDKNDPNYGHNMMEALWLHQWQNVVDIDLLKQLLKFPEPHVRAQATRVLCYWRDRVPEVLPLLKASAGDEDAKVRLQAVRAASFFRSAEAAEVALTSLKYPSDYYLNYTLTETMKQLEPYWKKAVAAGQSMAADNPQGVAYLTKSMSTADLMKQPKSPGTLQAVLARPDVSDTTRAEILNGLAEMTKVTRASAILNAIETTPATDIAAQSSIAKLLPLQPPAELKVVREKLETLAAKGGSTDVRSPALAAVAMADNSFDKVWAQAAKSPATLSELLKGIPLIYDADIRNLAFDKVLPLLAPEEAAGLNSTPKPPTSSPGRYVRIDLPGRSALTLAEVQIFSDGKNVAMGGKAKQSSTANGGDAAHAIDGNTDGNFGSGTQTHTKENEDKPWWEVDLGSERPIESVVIWNRTDGGGVYLKRLDNFTLTILDAKRHEVFKKAGNPAPQESVRITVSTDDAGTVRRAAIVAAVSMKENEAKVFDALATLIKREQLVTNAAKGIRNLPRNTWPKGKGGAIATNLVAWAKTVPAADRTTQEYLETVQFAGDLAGQLPAEQAASVRKDLKELRVATFYITTVREQMRYDTPRLVVEAGKPFEIHLENGDSMPHNLVVVNLGDREKFGPTTTDMKPDDLDAQGRPYMPKGLKFLAATKLIEPGQKTTLKMVAPEKEGDYDYFCTYPSHWELMWGRLVVTKDVDAYLQSHAEAPPTGQGVGEGAAAHVHHHGN